jgi:hypothetical protein
VPGRLDRHRQALVDGVPHRRRDVVGALRGDHDRGPVHDRGVEPECLGRGGGVPAVEDGSGHLLREPPVHA